MAISSTGINHIDALQTGYSWTGTTGIAYKVGYAFGPEAGLVVPVAMRGAYVAATKVWENVANISFKQVSYAVSEMDFYRGDLSEFSSDTIGITGSNFSGSTLEYTLLAIDDRFNSAASVASGTLGFLTLIHEIGHALGLKHPQNYGGSEPGPYLPANDDNLNASVMSYNESDIVGQVTSVPITPMIYDIAAMQYLYGANYNYNKAATTYTISGLTNAQTIWDGGGVDTISGVRVNSASVIDLREGLDNYSRIGNSYVWNAFGANIEKATTGNGNDTITGNSLNNTLIGNGGADVIHGGLGNDRLLGGAGIDTVWGDGGNDTMDAGNDNDTAYGGDGVDSILGGAGNDSIYGDNGTEGGGDGADRLFGGLGNDSLYGDGGADFIQGDAGNDLLLGGSGSDSLYGDAGNDILQGQDGNDLIDGGAGNDTLVGSGGNDTLLGGVGIDLFDFSAAGSTGADVIQRFEGAGLATGDVLYLNLSDAGFSDITQLLSSIVYSPNTALIQMAGGDSITLTGVTRHLVAADFLTT